MTSSQHGSAISVDAEIQNIFPQGIWIWVQGNEYLISFEAYPRLRDATVAQIHNVELPHADHLHWPELDIDVDLDALRHPDRYPLRFVG
jgi:hypothetical protein